MANEPENVSDVDRVMLFVVGAELPAGHAATLLHEVLSRAIRDAVAPAQGFVVTRLVLEEAIEQAYWRESTGSQRHRSLVVEDALDAHNLAHPDDPLLDAEFLSFPPPTEPDAPA